MTSFSRTTAMRPCWGMVVCVSLAGVGLCHAKSSSLAPPPAPQCAADAMHAAGYARSIMAVRQLPELDAWSRSHAFPVAFGESVDKQVVLDGQCYWSVSVFASRPERLELWNIFYVQSNGKRVLVQDPVSGDAISLEQWRTGAVRKLT